MSKTIQEQIEVMQHFANGVKVECLAIDKSLKGWYDEENPSFSWGFFDYRIKEQKKTITIEKWLNEDGRCIEIEKGKLQLRKGAIIIGSYEVEINEN